MRFRTLVIICLSVIGVVIVITAIIAMLNPMAFGFFAAMLIGITQITLREAPFHPRDAIVQNYETQCAPAPFLISSAQPQCRIDERDGALLKMVTLNYDTGRGHWRTGTTHLDMRWGDPAVGSHVTIQVNVFDPSKFKLRSGGWVNPGWCDKRVCY